MKVLIPCAGKGTRLRPHTHVKPKILIEAAGKSILDHLQTCSALNGTQGELLGFSQLLAARSMGFDREFIMKLANALNIGTQESRNTIVELALRHNCTIRCTRTRILLLEDTSAWMGRRPLCSLLHLPPESDDPEVMALAIEDFVLGWRFASFGRLQEWFGARAYGDFDLCDPSDRNIIVWPWLSKMFGEVIVTLVRTKRLEIRASRSWNVGAGPLPDLPYLRRRRGHLHTRHLLPSVLCLRRKNGRRESEYQLRQADVLCGALGEGSELLTRLYPRYANCGW